MGQGRDQADYGPGHGVTALPVHQLFLEIARQHPARLALRHDGGTVSYAELATASGRIAAHLAARAIGPGARVGLCGEAAPATMAALIGILRTGAAYVPFDPHYPAKALGFMREDSRPAVMLVSYRQAGIAALQGSSLVIEDLLEAPPEAAIPNAAIGPDALAYIMYTSGSTGRPKGVMVPHRAVTRLVRGADYASFGPDEVFLQQAPLAFDASTFEIWGALLNGATLALPSGGRASLDEIAEAIQRFEVTTLWLTAGLFHLMVDHRLDALGTLRQLLAGGDVLSPEHVRRFRQAVPGCRLINGYGPTENTTFSCCYTVPAEDFGDTVPIGYPINGTELRILDAAMQPAEEGELYLGGQGLALGYFGRPDLTAEKFVADPAAPGNRLYRTGDNVRRRPDGALDFLGRVDRQVKINGKRVELDEIEATARRSPLVADAVCLVIDGTDGTKRLALFVTPAAKGDVGALREALAAELPEHMRPGRLEFVAALPLTPNGKLDRAALAAQPKAPIAGIPAQIQALWARALGTETFGADENFFDLGGTSLQLTRLHAELQTALGRRLPVTGLFAHPTLRSLARWLDGAADEPRTASVLPTMAARRNAALARTRLARGSIVS